MNYGRNKYQILAQKQIFNRNFSENSIEHTDICPTGVLLWTCLAFVGASHQLRRFFALEPKDEQEGRSIW
jgi:hypothetical protein